MMANPLMSKMDKYKRKKAMYVTCDATEGSESEEDYDDEKAMYVSWPLKKIRLKIVTLR